MNGNDNFNHNNLKLSFPKLLYDLGLKKKPKKANQLTYLQYHRQ